MSNHTTDPERTASRTIPPQIDARFRLWRIPVAELWYLLPAAFVWLAVWFGSVLSIGGTPLIGGSLLALVLTLGGIGLVLGAHEYTSPRDLLHGAALRVRHSQRFPWTHDETAGTPIHGVAEIHAGGAARMTDERMVGAVRVDGTNTDLATDDRRDQLTAALAAGFDEAVQDFDVRLFSTTTPEDTTHTARYREQRTADAFAGAEWADARDILASVAEWTETEDAPAWDAREWQHYVIVAVGPGEVSVTSARPQSRAGRLLARFRDTDDTDARRQRQREVLSSRLDTIMTGVVGRLDGCDAARVGPVAHAQLVSDYYAGERHDISETNATGPAASALAPGHYDARDGVVRVGEQWARTLWVADWPQSPSPHLFRDVYTLAGVDVDVCIRAGSRDKRDRIEQLEYRIAQVDADVLEREDRTDISSVVADDALQALITQYQTLQQTTTQPWDLSAYVTVRAASREALDDATDTVRTALESSPADCLALAPGVRQDQLFRSAGPVGHDHYAAASTRERSVTVCSGAVGACFPFGTAHVSEPDGVTYGRHVGSGLPIHADPFDRGGAPHQLTIAKSGSGKTYATGQRALRWWLADPDRTLVMCDTMGGFGDLVDTCNGNHVVVDGSQTINPLDIQATATHASDLDPYRMKVDSVTAFLSGILQAQGVDPGPLKSTIEEVAEATFADAGITTDPATHDRDSPTMGDYLATLGELLDDPAAFTHTDHDREREQKERAASRLLDKFSGFSDGGKFGHLVGTSDVRIQPGEVSYLDLRQIEGQVDAAKSTMLHLMLDQVYQTVKRAPDKTLFVIDEAHYLLYSEPMVAWLQRAARHWRHHDAALHFVSQSPQEFVGHGTDTASEHRETIRGQCSTIEFFRTPNLSDEIAQTFGLNRRQAEWVRSTATPGSAGLGYSQGLVSFSDHAGWFRTQVEASPAEDAVLGGDSA